MPERGLFDVVGVRRLRQIVGGAELDRLDRGGDAGEAGQHDDPHRRVVRVQGRWTQARPEASRIEACRSTTANAG